MVWQPGKFLTANLAGGPVEVHGYLYHGLGIRVIFKASPKGRRPPEWSLIHLNSGHQVARIKGFVADAFRIATEIADCADWDFNGLDGWRNQEPDLPKLVRAVVERNAKRATLSSGGGSSQEIAATISASRQ